MLYAADPPEKHEITRNKHNHHHHHHHTSGSGGAGDGGRDRLHRIHLTDFEYGKHVNIGMYSVVV